MCFTVFSAIYIQAALEINNEIVTNTFGDEYDSYVCENSLNIENDVDDQIKINSDVHQHFCHGSESTIDHDRNVTLKNSSSKIALTKRRFIIFRSMLI